MPSPSPSTSPVNSLCFDVLSSFSRGQAALLIFRRTSSGVSSMKTAESGSLLDILACPAFKPIIMWCDRMIGLCLMPTELQYSRACMFTLRWSKPSWQMSARSRKMSVHCISGYRICAAVRFPSSRPIMVQHLLTRTKEVTRLMSNIFVQYSVAFSSMNCEVQTKRTFSIFMPQDFQTCTKYMPVSCIFFRSPPILSFISPNQSAT
mmetsp:Transcript_18407/g.43195  ORF Transcript_18407/g.43195 Transcript_18407/m.43195 type:complete len:206 (+) Transcript_18407:1387-2004(+)